MDPHKELNDLHEQIESLGREEADSDQIADCLARMEGLLHAVGADNGSIVLQDHWALFFEKKGDLERAAEHRDRELMYISRLVEISSPPIEGYDDDLIIRKSLHLYNIYTSINRNLDAQRCLEEAVRRCGGSRR